MKKVYRRSQIEKVVGAPIMGLDMHKYGLPYDGAVGLFSNKSGPDSIDLMLAAVESYYPQIHPVSIMPNGIVHNCYKEDATCYMLFTGDCDPEIEFSNEFSLKDFPEDELIESRRINDDLWDTPPTIAELNAIQWRINKTYKCK